MANQPIRNMMNEADDLLFRIKLNAGTGTSNIDYVSDAMRQMLELYNDATRFDRECETDDSAMQLSYVLEQFEMAIDHLKSLPTNNRSRTAAEAKIYRSRAA